MSNFNIMELTEISLIEPTLLCSGNAIRNTYKELGWFVGLSKVYVITRYYVYEQALTLQMFNS